MNFFVDINSDNEAMHNETVVINMLNEIIGDLRNGERVGMLRDPNGNTVGRWVYNEEEHSKKV